MLALIYFSHFEAVSQSHLDFKSVFAGYFARQVLFFALVVGHQLLKIPFSLVHLAIYQSVSIVLGAIVLFLFGRKHLLYSFNPTMEWIKKLLGFGGYIFGIGITSSIFSNLDQLMIARFTSSKSMVASYNAATRISGLVEIPSYSAAEILLPKVSQVDLREGPQQVKYMYERMVGILLCLTTPAALFIIIFPHFVVTLIAGAQYADSSFILQMYMLSGLVKPIQNQAANILLYIGKARLCFLLNILFVGINAGLNYICFIQFGPYGAAIGNVIGCVLGTIVWYNILKKSIGVNFNNIWKYILDTIKTIMEKLAILFKAKQVQL
jgi:O-antigen/teichoic acid export membrane protein